MPGSVACHARHDAARIAFLAVVSFFLTAFGTTGCSIAAGISHTVLGWWDVFVVNYI